MKLFVLVVLLCASQLDCYLTHDVDARAQLLPALSFATTTSGDARTVVVPVCSGASGDEERLRRVLGSFAAHFERNGGGESFAWASLSTTLVWHESVDDYLSWRGLAEPSSSPWLQRLREALAALEQVEAVTGQRLTVRFLVFAPVHDGDATTTTLLAALLRRLGSTAESAQRFAWTLFDSGDEAAVRAAAQVQLEDGAGFEAGSTLRKLIALGAPYNNGVQAHMLAKGYAVRALHDDSLAVRVALDVDVQRHYSAADYAGYSTFAEFAAAVAQPVDVLIDDEDDSALVQRLVDAGQPVVIRRLAATLQWQCFSSWRNLTALAERLQPAHATLTDVKVPAAGSSITWYETGSDGGVADAGSSLTAQLPFDVVNMSTTAFFALLDAQRQRETADDYQSYLDFVAGNETRAYYFGSVFAELVADVQPSQQLFAERKDHSAYAQFLWISSKGLSTQLHFDSDHNVFVQVLGRKRWLLLPHHQSRRLAPFAKISPRWHKSRLSMYDSPAAVNAKQPAAFAALQYARTVDLLPGDVLFVPGFYWHFVESLSTSISLSTWSHDRPIYDAMRAVYSFEHRFDVLRHRPAKVAALRLAVDLVLHEIAGFARISAFVSDLLVERFAFQSQSVDQSTEQLCTDDAIPIAQYVWEDLRLDSNVVAEKFASLPVDKHRTLLFDWLEDIAASVVGKEHVVAFFSQCFRGQSYAFLSTDEASSFWAEV